MALTQCPDCGKEVSTAARACPHCGMDGQPTLTGLRRIAFLVIFACIVGMTIRICSG